MYLVQPLGLMTWQAAFGMLRYNSSQARSHLDHKAQARQIEFTIKQPIATQPQSQHQWSVHLKFCVYQQQVVSSFVQHFFDMAQYPRTVEFERIQEQRPLVAKRVIETAATEVQGFNEIFNRSRRVTLAPEKMQCLDLGLFSRFEGFGASYFVPFIPE